MTTIFLAGLWGPVLLALGVGLFVSRDHYLRVYRELERESFAVMLFGLVGIAAGVAHVMAHNLWTTWPEVIVSLLGWGLLIKAAVFAIIPRWADMKGDWFAANETMINVASAVLIVLGGYLTWVAFLA